LLVILIAGIVAEVLTGEWIALPLSWLIICVFKLVQTARKGNHTIDTVFAMLYYSFSIVLMSIGIILEFWITSWTAFPIALVICWILSKFKRWKKVQPETEDKIEETDL
jgi:predicted membrane protein